MEWNYVPQDLYRSGNSSSPRLDNVRINRGPGNSDDVKTAVMNGFVYVYPNSGGVSVFSMPNYTLNSKWWKCPAHIILPSQLILIHDSTSNTGVKHFTLSPKYVMRLEEYKKLLLRFSTHFEKHGQ
jgi:hypothetical protein